MLPGTLVSPGRAPAHRDALEVLPIRPSRAATPCWRTGCCIQQATRQVRPCTSGRAVPYQVSMTSKGCQVLPLRLRNACNTPYILSSNVGINVGSSLKTVAFLAQYQGVTVGTWRREWDSNPRYGLSPYNGLANRRLRPLGHPSGGVQRRLSHALLESRPDRCQQSAPTRRGAYSCASSPANFQ